MSRSSCSRDLPLISAFNLSASMTSSSRLRIRTWPIRNSGMLSKTIAFLVRAVTRSLHRRNHELRALLHPARPARGHGLGLGIEPDRVRAVLVQVAEAGA